MENLKRYLPWIAGIVIVGGVAYYFWNKSQKDKETLVVIDEEEDEGVTLPTVQVKPLQIKPQFQHPQV